MSYKYTLLTLSLLASLTGVTHGAIVPITGGCPAVNDGTGCMSCFKEETRLYTCNPHQSSCQKDQASGLTDIAINPVGNTGNYIIMDDNMGDINFSNLQSQITWSMQSTVANMFEAPASYFTAPTAPGECGWQTFSQLNKDGYLLKPGCQTTWTAMKNTGWLRPDVATVGAQRNSPGYRIAYTPNFYTSATEFTPHRQCVYYYVRFCGDNVPDSDKGEQCDDGNMTNGDGCSSTCTTETQNLSCTNLTLLPATLTKNGGSLTATCAASISSGTQYKLILKQGATTIETINYQSLATKTFDYVIPANGSATSKTYSVDCFVKNGAQTDVTSASCSKNITVPGTVVEAAVCNSLTLGASTVQTNTAVSFVCNATNATSYIIKQGSTIISTLPEGTINFPTAGTYNIGCFIDGQTNSPASCAKSITVTNPPVPTIPSIFIDKDDSTPGTPDSDGNDIQRVQQNGTATFTVRVLNNGNEALKTVVIEDPLASDCARTSAQTASLYAGGSSTNFDVGETFNYQCTKTNVTGSTFTNNRNTATVKGVGVTSGNNVTDSDVTEIFLKQTNPSIAVEKDDTDNLDDEQEIDEDETAKFSVKVINDGDESLENVVITDDLAQDCERDESETRDLIRDIGNRDSLFDPGEKFTYTCRETSVTVDTFPDEINTVCVDANGVDTDKDVNSCDDTDIIINPIQDEEENLMCYGIESSEGTFGGAPFRTIITCDVEQESSCIIEVTKDGEVIHEYDTCTKNITFSSTGDYAVACIVDDERSADCEMEITVESMTDVPTGTKLLLIAFLSLMLSAVGTHIYKKRST